MEFINKNLKKGFIRESNSLTEALVLFVLKRGQDKSDCILIIKRSMI